MPFLERNGARLYYETHGAGPALVFAHGLGGGHLSWWQQVPHFRDRYTCVTFDHRGFGLSSESPEKPGPDAYVDDLAALVDHLGVPDVRLVAQSMGGWTCLGYALRHPERVRALVMAATTGHARATRRRSPSSRPTERPQPEKALFERGIHPAAGERMAKEQPALHFLYREIDALSQDLDKTAIRKKLIAMRTTPRATIAALRPPLLCVVGEEDIVIPPAAIAVLASIVPGARLARVPAAGHSVYFERPAGVQPPGRRVPGQRRGLTAAVPDFETARLGSQPDARAPDGSDVRILLQLAGGGTAHFELGPGQVSRAVTHRTVEEIWYVLGGRGEMWRRQGERESVVALEAGVCLTIPHGTHFQFRSLGPGPLAAVAVTMPPWPGADEAVPVDGRWSPTEPAG